MHNDNSIPQRRSLGALRKTPKTKPKSPDTQGAMKVQRHTIETLMRQLEDADADEIIANIAGWFNRGQQRQISNSRVVAALCLEATDSTGRANKYV